MPSTARSELPTFPGAQGFGAIATGGRGGAVVKVTTLAPEGPGSLGEALAREGPRTIVFDASGVITGDFRIAHGDLTIAGQTAPGAGITIQGRLYGSEDPAVQNIVVRHVRIRPLLPADGGDQLDAMRFSHNSRLMLDHVSVAWGIDETVDLYGARDVTVQWSTIEESADEGHPEGAHNFGLIAGPDAARISLHHNLFAHHRSRCPAIASGPAEVLGNVVYNVRTGFVHNNPASGQFNLVGNVFIAGPSAALVPFFLDDESGGADATLGYHIGRTFIEDPGDFVGVVDDPWSEPSHSSFEDLAPHVAFRMAERFDFDVAHPVTIEEPETNGERVLALAGAFPRDATTMRTLREVAERRGAWGPAIPNDLMRDLHPTEAALDLDGDGMPDAWERERGLDPGDPEDHARIMPSGYTAIEVYMNNQSDSLGGLPPSLGDTAPREAGCALVVPGGRRADPEGLLVAMVVLGLRRWRSRSRR